LENKLLSDAKRLSPALSIVDNIEVEATAVQRNINTFLTGKTIEFKSGSAEILPAGKAILDTIAMFLNEAPDATIEVAGHTDNQGNEKSNMALSRSRASATKAYLAIKGVQDARMRAVGYGQAQPVTTNFTPEGRQRNRRIQFTLH
jgi:OmpA-OmpF porin, OOP family